MISRSVFCVILLTLLLPACSGKSTSAVTEPAPLPTVTSTILASRPIPATGVPTLPPTNEPGCTDKAAFIADVTVPDGTVFATGTTFTKTWRISNSGTCAWNSEYSIVYSSGEKSNASDSIPLAYTAAGTALDISVDLIAPAKKGNSNIFFELHNPAGEKIPVDSGYFLYVSVYISGNPEPTSAGASADSAGEVCLYTTDPAKVAEAIAAINSYRAQNGRPAYSVNPLLTKAAQTHAADMACNNLFIHTGTDGSNPSTRVASAGYSVSNLTENVYGSYPPLSGQDVVAWWATDQLDPRHNENLISSKYTEIGVAYSFFNNFGYYVVDFASP